MAKRARSVDYRIDDLVLNVDGRRWDADIADSIVGGSYELTIEGASSVTLQVEDPDFDLLTSGTLTKWAWGVGKLGAPGVENFFEDEEGWLLKGRDVFASLDDLNFMLTALNAEGTRMTLTLEDRIAALLRRKRGARKAARSKVTRAEFVLAIAREVKYRGGIKAHIPELHKPQPIEKSRQRLKDDDRREDGRKGLDRSARVTVKGVAATPLQLRNMERAFDVADSLDAPVRVFLALAMVGTNETTWTNVSGSGDGLSDGILQLQTQYANSTDTRSIEEQVRHFLLKGAAIAMGAIEYARKNPSATPAEIARAVWGGTGFPLSTWTRWADDAKSQVAAYRGGGGRASTEYRTKSFQFERKRGENSWDAIGRLAEEVAWRRFTRGGRLWYASEEHLFRQKPALVVVEGKDGVDTVNGEIDLAARNLSAELTVQARAERWTALPGMVAVVREKGPFDGRWLVSNISGDLFDEAVTVTLRKPIPSKSEPAAERVAVRGRKGSSSGSALRDRIVAKAEKSLTSNTGHSYYSKAGALTDDPTPGAPNRSDCSQWVRAIYLHAGAPDPGTWTGDQWNRSKPTSDPKPGDLVIYGEGQSSHHVELYVGDGKTIGHGSPPIDYGTPGMLSGAHFRTYDFLD
jgi:hypothetical protein